MYFMLRMHQIPGKHLSFTKRIQGDIPAIYPGWQVWTPPPFPANPGYEPRSFSEPQKGGPR